MNNLNLLIMRYIYYLFCSFIFLSVTLLIYSCSKESFTTSDTDNLVELRSIKCDGAPMSPPTVIDPKSIDGVCCFTLKFSPAYLSSTPYQIIGFDSAGISLALAPNGFCVDELDVNNELYCCITNTASSITVSLNPHDIDIARCVEIPLPCK